MKALILLFAALVCLQAQDPAFPTAVATDAELRVAKNNVSTTLGQAMTANATSFTVASAAGITTNMLLTIGEEIVAVCGVSGTTVSVGVASCPNVDGRGYDNTTAATHSARSTVKGFITAWHHNAIVEAIKGTQTFLLGTVVDVRAYGALDDGSNNVTAIQAAVTAAPWGATLLFPRSTNGWAVSASGAQAILINKALNIRCEGSTIKLTGGTVTAVIRIQGAADNGSISGCRIVADGGTATNGVLMDASTGYIARWKFWHNWIGPFTAQGIATTFPTGTDGIFNVTIRESTVFNGIDLDRAGDTVTIEETTIVGTSGPGIRANLVPGASKLLISHNAIVTCGGLIHVVAGTRTDITHNNLEPDEDCPATDSMVYLEGSVSDPIVGAYLGHNWFSANPGTVTNHIRTNHAQYTFIDQNSFGRGDGTQRGLKTSANTLNTIIGNNVISALFLTHWLDDGSTTTMAPAISAGQLTILGGGIPNLASPHTVVFKATTGQAGQDLAQFQTAAGTVKATIGASGAIGFPDGMTECGSVGAGSKVLCYDSTDSNRVKIKP